MPKTKTVKVPKNDPNESITKKRGRKSGPIKLEPIDSEKLPKYDYDEVIEWLNKFPECLVYREENQLNDQQKAIFLAVEKRAEKNESIKLIKPPTLVNLEKYLFGEDENSIKFENGIQTDHLASITAWKLARGKFRMRLSTLVRENKDETVQSVTKTVYEKVNKSDSKTLTEDILFIQQLIKELSELRGIGPATASAILNMMNPLIPFMSDEAMEAVQIFNPKYDIKTYLTYFNLIREVLKQINEQAEAKNKQKLNARELEHAFYAKAILNL